MRMLDSITIDHGRKTAKRVERSAEAKAKAIAEYKKAAEAARLAREAAIAAR